MATGHRLATTAFAPCRCASVPTPSTAAPSPTPVLQAGRVSNCTPPNKCADVLSSAILRCPPYESQHLRAASTAESMAAAAMPYRRMASRCQAARTFTRKLTVDGLATRSEHEHFSEPRALASARLNEIRYFEGAVSALPGNGNRMRRARSRVRSSSRFRVLAESRSRSEIMPSSFRSSPRSTTGNRVSPEFRHTIDNHAQRLIGMGHHGFGSRLAQGSRPGIRILATVGRAACG